MMPFGQKLGLKVTHAEINVSYLEIPQLSTVPSFKHAAVEEEQYRRLVLNNSSSPTGMSALTHPLQRISGNDHDRRLQRSRRFSSVNILS